MNGHDIAKSIYQPPKKPRRKRKRIEKVTAPDHWRKDVSPHKRKQPKNVNPMNGKPKSNTP